VKAQMIMVHPINNPFERQVRPKKKISLTESTFFRQVTPLQNMMGENMGGEQQDLFRTNPTQPKKNKKHKEGKKNKKDKKKK